MIIPWLSRWTPPQSSRLENTLPRECRQDKHAGAIYGDSFERRAPAGGGGGSSGGGAAAAAAAGAGARAGGASSSSSGARGSSGSSGSGVSSVGAGAARQPLSSLPGGQSRVSPATAASQSRSEIFGSSGSSTRSFGNSRPVAGAPLPIYGFWPVYWESDDTDPSHPSNDSRPGGPLATAGIELPANQSQIYVLYGDRFSLDAILEPIMAQTGAVNVSLPSDLSHNVSVQQYRDQSFELLRLDTSLPTDINATFLPALNQSIGQNLPIGAAPRLEVTLWHASAIAALAGSILLS